MNVTVLGIRHHGPGSARSVLAELDRVRPDVVLVEGPPEASSLIRLAADPAMRPPVALLVYAPEEPRVATFFPMADFSPEWVAMRWALDHDAAVRFIDLSTGIQFAAVSEAMTAVRDALPERDAITLQREAAMRRGIRQAGRDGFERAAVVCGAWHAPALEHRVTAAADDRLLKQLPKPMKTAAAWVPWTHDRLAAESGYGAGITSPGWYHHLWTGTEPLAVSWMARVASAFREEGLDASAAHLVEAARLAEALATMRGRAVPSLTELNEAVRACLGFGSDLPLAVVRDRLIVGRVLGETPPDAPIAPLAADLDRETRRLRLKPEPGQKTIDLDLRSETDLARSHLLHRLAILD